MDRPSKLELIAYADGELPASKARAVEAFLRSSPDTAVEVRALRELRRRARSALRAEPATVPDDLRESVEALWPAPDGHDIGLPDLGDIGVAAEELPPYVPFVPVPRRRVPPWARWGGVAACVLLAATITFLFFGPSAPSPQSNGRAIAPPAGDESVVAQVQVVQAVKRKHLSCSRLQDHFYDPAFPRVLADVGAPARALLGEETVVPDLGTIGLRFDGAGQCALPGGATLHLLYERVDRPGVHVSLFVQSYAGRPELTPGQAVELAGPTSDHPLLCWRGQNLVYFLICDDLSDGRRAAAAMGRLWPG